MVNVVITANPVLQMHIVVDGGKDILLCNMLRNQIGHMMTDLIFDLLRIGILIQDLSQIRIVDKLRDSKLLRLAVHPRSKIDHHGGKDFDIPLLCLNHDTRDRSVLYLIRQLFCHLCACFSKDLSCCLIHHILRKDMAGNPVAEQ